MINQKKMTKAGGIGIPVSIRRKLNLQPGDAFDVEADGKGEIHLKPRVPRCVFCGDTEHVRVYLGKGICSTCAERVKGGDEA